MLKKFSNRLLMVRVKRDEKEIKIGFLLIGLVIIAIVSYLIYFNFQFIDSKEKNSATITDSSEFKEEVVEPTVAVATTKNVVLPTTIPVQNTVGQSKASFKDYYINLGSGTNRSTEWEDVIGTLSTFDIATYNNIKRVTLETTTNVPTSNGTISVRLYNKTDGYAVWNSERTVQAEIQGTLLISQNLNYDYGPKLYSIQMKSQLGVEANLTQARIHIVAQ